MAELTILNSQFSIKKVGTKPDLFLEEYQRHQNIGRQEYYQ